MSVLKQQVNSSSDFSSFVFVITYNSTVNFKLMHFLLWTKRSHENTNFDIFKCSDENLLNFSCHFWKHKSVFLQMLHQYSVPSSKTLLYFLVQTWYTLFKRSPLKCKFFRFLSARAKIRQIPHVSFETTSQFPFKFCVIRHCHDT